MSTGTPMAPSAPIRFRKVTPLEPVPQTATWPPAAATRANSARQWASSTVIWSPRPAARPAVPSPDGTGASSAGAPCGPRLPGTGTGRRRSRQVRVDAQSGPGEAGRQAAGAEVADVFVDEVPDAAVAQAVQGVGHLAEEDAARCRRARRRASSPRNPPASSMCSSAWRQQTRSARAPSGLHAEILAADGQVRGPGPRRGSWDRSPCRCCRSRRRPASGSRPARRRSPPRGLPSSPWRRRRSAASSSA